MGGVKSRPRSWTPILGKQKRKLVRTPDIRNCAFNEIGLVSQMNRAGDLDVAIRFVIDRIEGEAMRSGEPLDEHERHLLNNLPKSPTREEITSGDPMFPTSFQLRDITYERICAL